MILIVAKVKIRPEKVEEFENFMRAFEAKVRANEPDCILYRMARSRTAPNTYTNVEYFRDQAALDLHTSADYFVAGNAVTASWYDGTPSAEVFDTLD
jgi:quinol monooxygenase YgiN